ncbi:MAG: hypothetical protein H0T79_20685 [Deltaproteobacteria bacterium]|nr:hypothetical protein [Deltaproteobacteria bacterium]
MPLPRILVASVLALSALSSGACEHDHDPEGYATLQACFDVHTEEENLSVNEAVVVCCLDHAIGGQTEVCGATQAECVAYLSTALAADSATSAEIDASCTNYVTQREL